MTSKSVWLNRLVNGALSRLCERAHTRRLHGLSHVAVFADLWELLATVLVDDETEKMNRLGLTPPIEAKASTIDRALARSWTGPR